MNGCLWGYSVYVRNFKQYIHTHIMHTALLSAVTDHTKEKQMHADVNRCSGRDGLL